MVAESGFEKKDHVQLLMAFFVGTVPTVIAKSSTADNEPWTLRIHKGLYNEAIPAIMRELADNIEKEMSAKEVKDEPASHG